MKKILPVLIALLILKSALSQNCPTSFSIQGPSEVTAGDTLIFSAYVKGITVSLTYNWSISAGTIISGQGTSVIYVKTDSLDGMYVTATVELGGLPSECTSVSSSTVDILQAPEKIISVKYTTPQALTAMVQKFIKETSLNDMNISQTAFIFVYSGAATNAPQMKLITTAITKTFEKNGVYPFQYKIANGGKKKIASLEMYKLLPGVKEPKPSK